MSQLHRIAASTAIEPKADVVFVHGLGGDAFDTWRYEIDESMSWPHWLAAEFPNVAVWSLAYAASPTKRFRRLRKTAAKLFTNASADDIGESMPLINRAGQVLDLLLQRGLGSRPILMVCHSLGGLLVKEVLRKSQQSLAKRDQAIFGNTRSVLFLATPHAGASLASLADAFGKILGATASIDDLLAHDARLADLYDWYRNHSKIAGIETVSYFESRDLYGVRIVNQTSAHPGVGANPVALDDDHISIAKPHDRDAQVCGAARRLIEETLGIIQTQSRTSYGGALRDQVQMDRLLNIQLDIASHHFPLELTHGQPVQGFATLSDGDLQELDVMVVASSALLERLATQSKIRWLLLGPSGCGKTNFIRRTVFLHASDEPALVFYVALRDLQDNEFDLPIDQLLRSRISEFSLVHDEQKTLMEALNAKRGIYIFDGLDELKSHRESAGKFMRAIDMHFRGASDANVIITSRSNTDFGSRFQGYDQWYFNGIRQRDIRGFLATLKLGQTSEFDTKFAQTVGEGVTWGNLPFILIIAATAARSGLFEDENDNPNLYELIDKALRLVLKTRDKTSIGLSGGTVLTANQVSDVRNRVLRKIIASRIKTFASDTKNWRLESSVPLRINRNDVERMLDEDPDLPNLDGVDRFGLIPTGICLRETEVGKLELVHNTLRDFLYAEYLYRALNEKDDHPFCLEYYSPEILRLLAIRLQQENETTHTNQLLKWIRDADSLMVRKVCISLFGFFTDDRGYVNQLTLIYRDAIDIGIAGRLAEAVRRISRDDRLLLDYANRMASFDPREEERDEAFRPLTYELNDSIDLKTEVIDAFLCNLAASSDPHVLKQSLIFVYRTRREIPTHLLIRLCLQAVRAVAALTDTKSPEFAAHVRCLLYGLEGLKRDTAGYFDGLLADWQRELTSPSHAEVVAHIDRAKSVLQDRRFVLSEQLGSLEEITLARHGESFANAAHVLIGRAGDDEGLTPDGESEAQRVGEKLASITDGETVSYLSSPKPRAIETATIAAKGIRCKKSSDLEEAHFGDWTGTESSDKAFKDWMHYPWGGKAPGAAGESVFDVQRRTLGVLQAHSDCGVRQVVIFTHYFPIRALVLALSGVDLEQIENASLVRLTRRSGGRGFSCSVD